MRLSEYNPEFEVFEGETMTPPPQPGVLSEMEEMELASELLEVADEQELDRFLGDLIRKVGGGATGKSVGALLKGVVKKTLPAAGSALGGMVAGPFGARLGSNLASMADSAFGLELEGLSQEDQEFEAARRFVRFAADTARRAAAAPRGLAPRLAAQRAAAAAARRHAPGFAARPHGVRVNGGWSEQVIRDGRPVVIVNCQPPERADTAQQQPQENDMHDIDRTQMEYDLEAENFEYEQFESEGVFSEMQEMELASELMEIQNEAELEQFLGSLIKKAGSAIGKVVSSPLGKSIGGMLKTVAGKALPLAGTALGGFVGGPIGAKIGGGLANMAKDALGLEMEAFEQEDREFEGAKQFVRMAGQAVKSAATSPSPDPRAAARVAVTQAVRNVAPGLLSAPPVPGAAPQHHHHDAASCAHCGTGQPHHGHHHHSGRWERHGRKIVLLGV